MDKSKLLKRIQNMKIDLEIELACPYPNEVDYDYITELREFIATLTVHLEAK